MDNGVHPNLDLDLKAPEGVGAYQLEETEEAFEGAGIVMSGVNSFGVSEMFALRDEGYPTACATMSHLRQVQRVLSVLDLDDAFDLVVTMDDVERGKPDTETLPDVVNRCIEEAGGGLR